MGEVDDLSIVASYDLHGGPVVIEAFGSLGRNGAEHLLGTIQRAGDVLILDLGAVTAVDADGVRTLVVGTQQLRHRGVRVLLCELQPHVESRLNITGGKEFLEVYPTRAAAVEQLRR